MGMSVAEKKGMKAVSKVKLAKASKMPKAIQIANAELAKRRRDAAKVKQGMKKVQERKAKDKAKKGKGGKNSAVSAFAHKMLSKWENVHKMAFQERRPKGLNAPFKTRQLEQRIAALEAALREAGADVKKIEGKDNSKKIAKIKKEIAANTSALKKTEAKIAALGKVYGLAKKKKDNKSMIKAGTEKKDLSVSADNTKSRLQKLYASLKAAEAEQKSLPAVPSVPALPAVPDKASTKKSDAMKKVLAKASKGEKKKLALAKKAGKAVKAKRKELDAQEKKEMKKAKAMEKEIAKAKKNLSKTEAASKKKMESAKKKLADAKKSEGKLKKVEKKAKAAPKKAKARL